MHIVAQRQKRKPEMKCVIIYFGFNLSYSLVQKKISNKKIKDSAGRENILIRRRVAGASTFVLFPAEVSHRWTHVHSWLFAFPLEQSEEKRPEITPNIREEWRLTQSDGTATGILGSNNAYINAAFLLCYLAAPNTQNTRKCVMHWCWGS